MPECCIKSSLKHCLTPESWICIFSVESNKRQIFSCMNLYVSRDGQTFGPYTVEQAHQYLNGGQLLTSDFALLEGSSEWKTLPEVLGILTHQTGLGVPASQTLGENQDQSVSTRQEPSSSRTEPKVKTTGRRSSSGKKSKKLKGLNQPQTIIVQPKKSIFSRIFSTIQV